MKVALVGGTASREDAPYRDPAWEIWAPATVVERVPKVHRLFEIHDREHWLAHTSDHRRVQRLNAAGCPVLMREIHADVPRSMRYPLEAVVSRFGAVCPNTRPDYFASTIDYMLALCALLGPDQVERVALYGINMTGRSEYAFQMPSCNYWCGLLRGLGIEVWIHQASPLLKLRAQYGTAEWSTPEVQKRYGRELAPL